MFGAGDNGADPAPGESRVRGSGGSSKGRRQAVFSNSSRPISMRRISLVPAPIS